MSEELDRLIMNDEIGLGARNPGLQLMHYKNPKANSAYRVADNLLSRLAKIREAWEGNETHEGHQLASGGSSCWKGCPCCAVDDALEGLSPAPDAAKPNNQQEQP